jgi:hypothetical protein
MSLFTRHYLLLSLRLFSIMLIGALMLVSFLMQPADASEGGASNYTPGT